MTTVQLKLSDDSIEVLTGEPAIDAWASCCDAMEREEGIVASVLLYKGKRVLAYRIEDTMWRSLSSFDILPDQTDPPPSMM